MTQLSSDQAFAEKMVAKYRDLLLQSAGLTSISIDGQSVSYADLEAAHDHWTKKLARLSGSRPIAKSINLENT